MIDTIPNFLSDDEMQAVEYYLDWSHWGLQVPDNRKHCKLRDGFLFHGVSDTEERGAFFWDSILKKVRQSFGLNNDLQRIYFNGQWFGRDGKFHKDNCDKTVLIYISDWQPEWGGFTHLMDGDDHAVVMPITNTAVCFPGNMLHKAYAFSQQTAPMRVTLAYKFT